MMLRLLKSNVVKSILQRCPASRPIACRISSLCPISNYSGSSFFQKLDSQLSGCGGLSQVSCVRPYHKLFVEDLPLDVTEELVRQHFSQCGMVLSVKIVRNPNTVESRRHGYVSFADKEALGKAVSSQPHLIGSQAVIIRPVQQIQFLVTQLSPSSTEQSLLAYFSRYGTVLGCNLKRDPMKEINCGFVVFSDINEVDKELVSKVHVIDGQQVKVVRVMPKELTLFVGNLSPTTTDQSLHGFYSQFGNLLQAEVKQDRWTGRSRCFGYVCFSSQQELDNAVRGLPHIIDGEEVKINYTTREFTLFVADLPTDTSENRLREYFEQFGPVYGCNIARDKQTNQLLHHGWVIFSSQQGLNCALASRPLVIDGKFIDANSGEKRIRAISTLYVGRLSPRTTDQMLSEAFSKFGTVVRSEVKLNRMNGQSRGFGYVTYSSPNEVFKALRAGPHVVDGRVLTVVPYKISETPSYSYVARKEYQLH